MEGSEDEETVVMRKKPAKITRHIIEAARTTKAKLDAKPVASVASNVLPPTGKHKLKREGA